MFDLKFDGELNTTKVDDSLIFPTEIYLLSSDQQFRRYGFLLDDGLLKTVSGQIAVTKEN
jgi:hypothetical protein